jgi:hypothetical protein
MEKKQPDYLAYMLRLWRVGRAALVGDRQAGAAQKLATWRASLQKPGTKELKGFACLDELFEFLEDQTQGAVEDSE